MDLWLPNVRAEYWILDAEVHVRNPEGAEAPLIEAYDSNCSLSSPRWEYTVPRLYFGDEMKMILSIFMTD